MFPLDFPNSPSNGDTYSASGKTWTYNGTGWTLNNAGASAGGDLTGSYPNPTIASGAVTTADLADSAVTDAKMAAGVFVPVGAMMPYAGTAAPTNWLLCDGSEKAVATYPDLDAVLTTTYGARTNGSGGAGSSHFRLPDLRGRVPAGKDDMGGSAASRLTSTVLTASNTLGATGGEQTYTLSTTEMPSHTHVQNSHNHTQNAHTHIQDSHNHTQNAHTHTQDQHRHGPGGSGTSFWNSVNSGGDVLNGSGSSYRFNFGAGAGLDVTGYTTATNQNTTATNIATTATNQNATATNNATTATNQNTGGGGAHSNTQPTIVLNYIIRAK